MSDLHKFKTSIVLLRPNGDEHEIEVEVEYRAYRGCAATHTQPGEDDSVEIVFVGKAGAAPSDNAATLLGDMLCDDEELLAECMQRWVDYEADAAEYRAEQRRDDAMMERWA